MSFDKPRNLNTNDQWEKFCDLLYFNEDLGIWLDASRMSISLEDLESFRSVFSKALASLKELENGSIANCDEQRQVGHYWLRAPELSPNKEIQNSLIHEIREVDKFSKDILLGEIVGTNKGKFTDVLWIGIGGSSLGPILLVESLKEAKKGLNFHFLDNVDPKAINDILINLKDKLDKTLIVVVSKSGGTPEPLIGMEQIRYYFEQLGYNWPHNSIAITMKNSKLYKLANSENWLKIFDLPDWVGGRTSITSSVGLLPAGLIGANIQDFLNGSKIMDELTRNTNIKYNPAALLALAWYKAGEGRGVRDMVVLPYKDRLQVFSKYLQQLVMESLGKKFNRKGDCVYQGLAVYGNKGSTDQHAYVQQLRDGLDNFFVTFIEVLQDEKGIKSINGKNPGDYLSGFLQGTRAALSEAGRQSISISVKKLDSTSLGALIALFERAVGLYAELIDINAYHQPGVEAGKKAASNILDLQVEIEELLSDCKSRKLDDLQLELKCDSIESIFWIIRHLSLNNPQYSIDGDWGRPNELVISKMN